MSEAFRSNGGHQCSQKKSLDSFGQNAASIDSYCTNCAQEKVCTKCKTWKGLDRFHKKPTGVLGLESHCKDCVSLRKKAKKVRRNHAKRANEARRRTHPSKVISLAEYEIKTSYIPTEQDAVKQMIKDFIERIIWRRMQS